MISIICVYNNKDILESYLLKSLKNQTAKFELLTIDNTKQQFKSAAEVFNKIGAKVKNQYIMFVHQDVELVSNSWLEDAERYLNTIQNLGIAGVAGMSETGKTNRERGRNIIEHGTDHRIWEWGNKINAPELVQTLDECLVIIPKAVFQILKFDEEVCEGWHLYAVDYCLSAKKMNMNAYVIPMPIYHRSLSILSSQYYQTIEKIIIKHKDHIKHIYTTRGDWDTSMDTLKRFSLELEEKNKIIEQITFSMKQKDIELNYIHNSLFWKGWNFYGRLINTILPQGSKRKKLYTLFINKIKRSSSIEGFDKWAKTETANVSFLPNIYRMNNSVYKDITTPSLINPQYDHPPIDIIIVTYNSSKFVENLYKSILASNYELKKLNITFVDNNSEDDTVELLNGLKSHHKIGDFKIIRNSKNIGYGSAINLAARSCKSNYILILNPDIEVHPVCIKTLIETALTDKAAYLWEPRQFPYEHPKFYHPITLETIWSSGAGFLIRKDKFEEINGFDESFFMYAEDVDLSFRLRNIGGVLRYVPKAIIWHYSYNEAEEKKPVQQEYSVRNHLLLRYKFGSLKDIVCGYKSLLKLLLVGDKWIKNGRSIIVKIFLSHIKHIPGMLRWRFRKLNYSSFKRYRFLEWDYEFRKDGAFYENSLPSVVPLVSVIIRTMNRPTMLKTALCSIANQTYSNIEVVVIEDGPPLSGKIIEGFRQLNIVYTYMQENVGRCKSGNLGLETAKGEYIIFLDDDDIFYPDHVEVLVNALNKNPTYLAAYAYSFEAKTKMIKNEYVYEKLISYNKSFDKNELTIRNLFPLQSVMFHRSLYEKYGGFDEKLEVLEDWDLWRRFSQSTDFLTVPKTTSEFRTSADSKTNLLRQKILDDTYSKVINKHINRL
ncbi:glycosyltransferase [Caldisericum sp.]|uniref:glycosyltransferase n=1 Tax=Caldisericum sp. TaxID=2499687 RepID=UPI003D09C53A